MHTVLYTRSDLGEINLGSSAVFVGKLLRKTRTATALTS